MIEGICHCYHDDDDDDDDDDDNDDHSFLLAMRRCCNSKCHTRTAIQDQRNSWHCFCVSSTRHTKKSKNENIHQIKHTWSIKVLSLGFTRCAPPFSIATTATQLAVTKPSGRWGLRAVANQSARVSSPRCATQATRHVLAGAQSGAFLQPQRGLGRSR